MAPKINPRIAAYVGGVVASAAVYFLVIQPYNNKKSEQRFEAEARALYHMKLKRQGLLDENDDKETFK